MKFFIILLFSSMALLAGPKEDLQKARNEAQLLLIQERLKLIVEDTDLKILHDNILRTHAKLASALAQHPELKKNPTLKEPQLSKLKLKLIEEDEDLRDLKNILIQRHRKLETLMIKNEHIKSLTNKLDALNDRLEKL
jgi:hypothetical protein